MKLESENSQYSQVEKFAMQNQLNIDWLRIETINQWILNIKEIKNKLERLPKNDIRIFFIK